jgi:hypothetical protein
MNFIASAVLVLSFLAAGAMGALIGALLPGMFEQ